MKLVRTYEDFNSTISPEKVKIFCSDLLIELVDDGFKTDVTTSGNWVNPLSKSESYVNITISKNSWSVKKGSAFYWDEVKLYVMNLTSYLSKMGFNIINPYDIIIRSDIIRGRNFEPIGVRSVLYIWYVKDKPIKESLEKDSLILESLEKNIELSNSILNELKSQNKIINDIEDIMLEVCDSWGFQVEPTYYLRDTSNPQNQTFAELWLQPTLDYFGMSEGDFDDPNGDFEWNVEFINNIRTGKVKSIVLDIDFQYANEGNGFKPLKENEEQKEILSEAMERMKSIGCSIERDDSPEASSLGSGLWKIKVTVPITFKPHGSLSSLDGVSSSIIKDFNTFIKKYNIDNNGQVELANLIRKVK